MTEEEERRQRQDAIIAQYEAASPAMKRRMAAIVLTNIANSLARIAKEQEEDLDPEELPADDQDAIDAAFGDIMEGLDL